MEEYNMARKKPEEFLKEFNALYNGTLILDSTYIRRSEKVKVRCAQCGFSWEVLPGNLMCGRKCPMCNPSSHALLNARHSSFQHKTTEQFSKEVTEITKGSISLVGKYEGSGTKTSFHCNIHNTYFSMTPTSFLRVNYRCPKCKYEHSSLTQRKSDYDFRKELDVEHNGEIVALDQYRGTHTKIRFRCQVCGCIFKTEPNAILRLSGCPSCAEPKGESAIESFLKAYNISYIRQKSFDRVKSKKLLRYDFYVPSLNLLIEYDGAQHYRAVEFFGGKKALYSQKKRDAIKDKYAIDSGIHLVRITYVVPYDMVGNALDKYLSGNIVEGVTVVS